MVRHRAHNPATVGSSPTPATMLRLLRKLLVYFCGAPVCRSCERHGLPCIRRCGMSEAERRATFIATGHLPR